MDIADAQAFIEVLQAGGFRQAAKATGKSASGLSACVRRLEDDLGVSLLYRNTRNVAPTECGEQLLKRLAPALAEAKQALAEAAGASGVPAGVLRLNVPVNAAKLILPGLIPGFLRAYPHIRLEVAAQSDLIDVLSAGYDAGIRYDDHLELDMMRVPIGPRRQRFATVAAPSYLARNGVPQHPRDLMEHACLRDRVASGRMSPWEFERDGEVISVDPPGPLVVCMGTAVDLIVSAAVSGVGVLHIFEEWVQPELAAGALVPILEPWWQTFAGPYLYFSGARLLPAALRAFIDYAKTTPFPEGPR